MGKLPSYLMAMLQKRKADWLSMPVLAAACVNPAYVYSSLEGNLWPDVNPAYVYSSLEGNLWPDATAKPYERAVAGVIKKLLWGDDDAQQLALDGSLHQP
eukprot:3029909-Prymnesium_polylepis.2